MIRRSRHGDRDIMYRKRIRRDDATRRWQSLRERNMPLTQLMTGSLLQPTKHVLVALRSGRPHQRHRVVP